MHKARASKAFAQDVCILCAFRDTAASRRQVTQRQWLGTSSLPKRQNALAAFQAQEDNGGFGGLADEVEESMSIPSQAPGTAGNTLQHQAGLRRNCQPVRASDPNGWKSQTPSPQTFSRLSAQQSSTPNTPRFRRITRLESKGSSTDVSVDTSRWTIGRKTQPRQSQGMAQRTTPTQTSRSQPFERAFQAKPLSNYGTGGSIPLSRESPPTSYVPFDSRYNVPTSSSPSRQKNQIGRATRAPAAIPFKDQASSTETQGNVGWAPAVPPAVERSVAMPSLSQARKSAPRDLKETQDMTTRLRPERPSREELDEFGLPIQMTDANLQAQQSKSSRSMERDKRVRNGRETDRHARDEEDDDDRGTRKKDRKKSRTLRGPRDNDDFDAEEYHRRKRERQAQAIVAKGVQRTKAERRTIRLPDFIRVGVLATELQLRYSRFAEILQKYGFDDVNSDFVLSAENAALIVEEAGFRAITESKEPDDDLYAASLPEDMSVFPQRPPVVTIMGHVDHGKTTILDYMRKSSIVASEHGGITQHIGAFSVPMPSGKKITFLDTPGHAAFLSMRQRGANVTDIVILVVAADDGVMPQTLEALKHARAANVPIIVAMNKIDKPEAKPDQVKQDLARHGVDIEDFGGDVQVVQVSGKTGQGMPDLEEAIVALSEIQDQRAPIDGNVEGWVLESSTKEVGKVATVLIRRGTLRPGDIVVAGTEYCRVRTMRDEYGNQIPEVGPGMPAEIDGWRGQPNAGDEVLQAPNEQVAGDVIDLRAAKLAKADLSKDVEAINEQRKLHQIKHERDKAIERAKKEGLELPEEANEDSTEATAKIKDVFFIVKADVAGSVEAVVNSVATLGNGEVRPNILKAAVGAISESDVNYAIAAGGQLISFNTLVPSMMRAMAERAGVKILDHNVIYRLVDDVKASLEDVLPPIVKSKVLGEAEISQIFEINQKRKKVKIAGCKVRNGTIMRNAKVKVLRGLDNEVVYTGSFTSLKNVKKDVMEMGKGTECGMGFADWQDFQPGDVAQCYEEWEEKRKL